MHAKYINPFTDFGFKKLFGEEASKPALIDFLNAILEKVAPGPIMDLRFRNAEQQGAVSLQRNAVYDIYCENEKGEKFIVELQKARQDFFKERTIFYSTFPIREQAEKGEWDFNLSAVYCIGILDFVFRDRDHSAEEKEVIHYIKLKDQYCRVFYDKLMYVYIEMPKFTKQPHELETRLDKWLYFIRHLEDFQSIPEIFKNEVVFLDLLDKATIAAFNQSQLSAYEDSLKAFRDIKNVEDSAFREGLGQGVVQGIVQVAAQMKAKGFDIATICDVTGLSAGEVSLL